MRFKTVEDLDYPEYIHLKINEEKKHLFIERCDWDMDAFRILYNQVTDGKKVKNKSCFIYAKSYLKYLAGVIGVPYDSPSLSFEGQLMPDGTVFIDLNQYKVIEPRKNSSVNDDPE